MRENISPRGRKKRMRAEKKEIKKLEIKGNYWSSQEIRIVSKRQRSVG